MNDRLPLNCHIQGKQNKGRIIKKWIDNIKEDVRDLALRQATDATKRDTKVTQFYVQNL